MQKTKREIIAEIEGIEKKLHIKRIEGSTEEEIYQNARNRNEFFNIFKSFGATLCSSAVLSIFNIFSAYTFMGCVAGGLGVYYQRERKEEELWRKRGELEFILYNSNQS